MNSFNIIIQHNGGRKVIRIYEASPDLVAMGTYEFVAWLDRVRSSGHTLEETILDLLKNIELGRYTWQYDRHKIIDEAEYSEYDVD